jgi:hypothetical protein
MTVDITSEIWSEIKRFISPVDRIDAADIIVNVLIDNDYDAEEIKNAFKSDADIKAALQEHLGQGADEEDIEEDYAEYDEDEDNDY